MHPGREKFEEYLQITALPRRTTVALRRRDVAEASGSALDALFVSLDDIHGFIFGASDGGFAPGRWTSRIAVFDEEMRTSYFPVEVILAGDTVLS